MKTSADKKVNQLVKQLNRALKKDVFGPRFLVKQISKRGFVDCHEIHVYQYELQDNEQPERNKICYFDQFEIVISRKLDRAMNDFIVQSNFWSEMWPKKKEAYFKNKDMCFSCKEYVPYTIRKERMTVYSYPDSIPYNILGERAYCRKCKKPIMPDDVEVRNLKRVQEINPNVKQITVHNYKLDI